MIIANIKKGFTYELKVFFLFLIILFNTLFYYYGFSQFTYEISLFLRLAQLEGDLGTYLVRFLLFFVFLGVIPLLTVKLMKLPLYLTGITCNFKFLSSKLFWITFVFVVFGAISGSFNPALQAYYPLSNTILIMSRVNPIVFVVHGFLYTFLYYIPWEMSFRGLLLLPLAIDQHLNKTQLVKSTFLVNKHIWFLMPQIAVTVLLHLPHPFSETLGSVIFGIVAGILTLQYKSILPGLILHIVAGITLDFFLIFIH
jgi:hypothetical protein